MQMVILSICKTFKSPLHLETRKASTALSSSGPVSPVLIHWHPGLLLELKMKDQDCNGMRIGTATVVNSILQLDWIGNPNYPETYFPARKGCSKHPVLIFLSVQENCNVQIVPKTL